MIGKIILAITGIGAGFIISAGVFALITSTGIITRFADKPILQKKYTII